MTPRGQPTPDARAAATSAIVLVPRVLPTHAPDSTRRREPWRGHVPALDGVRGLAIALVMFAHVVIGAEPTHTWERGVVELARAGWIGVDLFFVLSGFLITGILVDSREDPRYFRNFYIRRTLRIFPLYYGILAAVFIVGPLLAPIVQQEDWYRQIAPNQWWFWTYSSNVLLAKTGHWGETPILGGFWSLAVEEQFYLIWPVIVLACSPRRLRQVCASILVGALAFRVAIRLGMTPSLGAYTLMPARADALAAGAWLAVALRTGVRLEMVRRYARVLLVAAGLPIVAMLRWRRAFWEMDLVVQTVGYTCLALGFAALLALVLDAREQRTVLGDGFRRPLLRMLGKYSYAIYCFNPLVLKVLRRLGITPDGFPQIAGSAIPGYAAFGVLFFALSVVLAMLSWHLFEKHFLALKDRLAPTTRKSSEVGSARVGLPATPSTPGPTAATQAQPAG